MEMYIDGGCDVPLCRWGGGGAKGWWQGGGEYVKGTVRKSRKAALVSEGWMDE